MVRIRLTKKLAASLNGVDLSSLRVGDEIDLSDAEARMMIAERWAEPVGESVPLRAKPPRTAPAT